MRPARLSDPPITCQHVYSSPMTKVASKSSKTKKKPGAPTGKASAKGNASRKEAVRKDTLLTPETLPRPVMAGRDFLSNLDMTAAELRAVMDTAHSMKRGEWRGVTVTEEMRRAPSPSG